MRHAHATKRFTEHMFCPPLNPSGSGVGGEGEQEIATPRCARLALTIERRRADVRCNHAVKGRLYHTNFRCPIIFRSARGKRRAPVPSFGLVRNVWRRPDPCHCEGASAPAAIPRVSGSRASAPAAALPSPSGIQGRTERMIGTAFHGLGTP